jgi:phosphatidate cytidylyltransferase
VKLKNLVVRLLTAAVLVPVLTWALFLAAPWVWYALVLAAVIIAAMELFSMTHAGDPIAQAVGVGGTALVSLAVYLFSNDARVLMAVLLAAPVGGMLVPLWRLGEIPTAGLRQMAGVGGPLYVGGLLTTVAMLRRDLGAEGGAYVALALTFAWLADTGAYFSGTYFGKAKLYPEISPGKTRAGFIGALVGSAFGALVAHFWYLPSLPLLDGLALALVAGATGQAGDLAESLLKRSSGMKDSGWILPGHGGLLDRIDSLLVVSPIVYLYTLWVPRAGAG